MTMTMQARIEPLSPPYAEEVAASLTKWMPPGSAMDPLVLFRTLARHPLLSERMRPLGAAFLGKGLLAPRVRELVILRVCARCGSEYEWGVHVTAFAAAVGIDEATVRATVLRTPAAVAASGTDDDWVLRFVDELHDGARVAEGTWAALSERFTDPELLELVALAGFYHLIAFVTNATELPNEPWAERFPEREGATK